MNSECHFWPNTWKRFVFSLCHHRFGGFSPVLSWSSFWSCGQLSYQVTRLREYQGVDPHFDTIARQYHDIVKVTPVCILPLLSKILSWLSYQASSCRNWKTCNGQSIKLKWTWNGYQIIQGRKLDLFLDFLVLL